MEASDLIFIVPIVLYVISPLVAAWLIRSDYQEQLSGLMAASSPTLAKPPQVIPAGVRERLPAVDFRLPAFIRHPQAALRVLLYVLVFWLAMDVIVPASAPLLGLRADEGFDWGVLLPAVIVGLVLQHRTALGYSGLGIYAFVQGAAFSTFFGGLLAITGMSIWQCIQGEISVLHLLGWLVLGLPFVAFLFTRAFQFTAVINKLLLYLHVAIGQIPVGPGFKAFCFASMCMGMLYVPDKPATDVDVYSAHASDVSWELIWQTLEPWLRVALALALPFACVLALGLVGLALLRWSFSSNSGRTVLYLRAFANKRMSTNFLRNFCRSWLERGAIHVISGPDVASHVMDASTLAAYLRGDLAHAFIHNTGDLQARLEECRKSRGWDLRFQIQEFRCSGAVWIDAFRALLATADRAIIDLRGFSSERAGIAFELVNVLQTDHAGKSIFIVDSETSLKAIESLWATAATQPPGLATHFAKHGLELIKVGSTSFSTTHVVLRECEAALAL